MENLNLTGLTELNEKELGEIQGGIILELAALSLGSLAAIYYIGYACGRLTHC